jgi:hypothetical protein
VQNFQNFKLNITSLIRNFAHTFALRYKAAER